MSFGNDQRRRLSDEPDHVIAKQRLRKEGKRLAGPSVRLHRQRERAQPVSCHILRCQNRRNADASPCGGHVGALDPCMGMWRPQ